MDFYTVLDQVGEPPPQPWARLLSSAHDPVWPHIAASLLREPA